MPTWVGLRLIPVNSSMRLAEWRDRGERRLAEGGLDRVMMGLQVAGGATKLQVFEGLNAPSLILLEVAAHGVFTHTHTGGDLVVRQAFGASAAPLPSCVAHVGVDGDSAGNPVP